MPIQAPEKSRLPPSWTHRRMPALLAELTCYYSELSGGGAGLNTAPELSGAPVSPALSQTEPTRSPSSTTAAIPASHRIAGGQAAQRFNIRKR